MGNINWGASWGNEWINWQQPRIRYAVLFPVQMELRSKKDRALYALAIIARDGAPIVRMPSFKPARVRKPMFSSLDYDPSVFA